ncbi:MAG: hypothetical protein HYR85_01985 [Planctomycetes bacterium]|nr:hypothetical protein [Planctomycetota bacterium]
MPRHLLVSSFVLVAATALFATAPRVEAQTLTSRLVARDMQGGYVIGAAGLRTVGASSSIAVSGVPAGGAVKCAILYWDVLADGGAPSGAQTIVFAGTSVTGTLIGAQPSPNQPQTGNYSYMVDVTGWMNLAGNGSYSLSGYPWTADPNASPTTEGASLVVIWGLRDAANLDLLLYDGNATLNSNGAGADVVFSGFEASPSVTMASVAFVVGDGEPALGDSAYVDGQFVAQNAFAGDASPGGGSFWDSLIVNGSSGLIPNGATSATLRAQDDGDGIAWVASVLSVDSPFSSADVHIQPQTLLVARGSDFVADVSALAHSASPVDITGQVEVRDDHGRLLGLFGGPQNGRLRPGHLLTRTIRRRIPTSGVPPRLVGTPITVIAKLFQQGTSNLIDDDFCRFVIQ